MTKVIVSDTNLTNIANAIRNKNGETKNYKIDEMATAITSISSGSSSSTPKENINVTFNLDIYSYMTFTLYIPVWQTDGTLKMTAITSSGTYTMAKDQLAFSAASLDLMQDDFAFCLDFYFTEDVYTNEKVHIYIADCMSTQSLSSLIFSVSGDTTIGIYSSQ